MTFEISEKFISYPNIEKFFARWNSINDTETSELRITFKKKKSLKLLSFLGISISFFSSQFLSGNKLGEQDKEIGNRINSVILNSSFSFQKNWNLEITQNLADFPKIINSILINFEKHISKKNAIVISKIDSISSLSWIGTDFKSFQNLILSARLINDMIENSILNQDENILTKMFNNSLKIFLLMDIGIYLQISFIEKNSSTLIRKKKLPLKFFQEFLLSKTKNANPSKTVIKLQKFYFVKLKYFPEKQKFNFSNFLIIRRK